MKKLLLALFISVVCLGTSATQAYACAPGETTLYDRCNNAVCYTLPGDCGFDGAPPCWQLIPKTTCVLGGAWLCSAPGHQFILADKGNARMCAATPDDAEKAYIKVIAAPTFNLCNESGGTQACKDCVAKNGVWTAIGCVPTTRSGIVSSFLTLAISLSGGVILLRLLQASFMLSTSQGEPNKVKEAQEVFTSSFAGLLFVLFSIVILNTIGVTILRIPGF